MFNSGTCTCTTAGTPNSCSTCGDSTVDATYEACDDGNIVSGDGCSSTCTIEANWVCNAGNPSNCFHCGNGIKENTETCDDGNNLSGDGCSSTC